MYTLYVFGDKGPTLPISAMTTQDTPPSLSNKDKMTSSNLKQHFNSIVQEFIPLGPTSKRHCKSDVTKTFAHPKQGAIRTPVTSVRPTFTTTTLKNQPKLPLQTNRSQSETTQRTEDFQNHCTVVLQRQGDSSKLHHSSNLNGKNTSKQRHLCTSASKPGPSFNVEDTDSISKEQKNLKHTLIRKKIPSGKNKLCLFGKRQRESDTDVHQHRKQRCCSLEKDAYSPAPRPNVTNPHPDSATHCSSPLYIKNAFLCSIEDSVVHIKEKCFCKAHIDRAEVKKESSPQSSFSSSVNSNVIAELHCPIQELGVVGVCENSSFETITTGNNNYTLTNDITGNPGTVPISQKFPEIQPKTPLLGGPSKDLIEGAMTSKGSPVSGDAPEPDDENQDSFEEELTPLTLNADQSYSESSDDENLPPLDYFLNGPPSTCLKDTFSQPTTKSKVINTLDQMLIEKKKNERMKEDKMKLQLTLEDTDPEEGQDSLKEDITLEQKNIIQKYSLSSGKIKDVPPGEVVFSLSKFAQLFSHRNLLQPTLQTTPSNPTLAIFLRASPEQALMLVRVGLLKKAYTSCSCHPEVARWLFQMMSVHPSPATSADILSSLKHLALVAAESIVGNKKKMLEIWVPSVQDVALIFLNMGVQFLSMFPQGPPFTEKDVVRHLNVSPSAVSNHNSFTEHNFQSVLEYMAVCAGLCPQAYSDQELVLLFTLFCRLSLDVHLLMIQTACASNLMNNLINNIKDWSKQMPQLCLSLTKLTDDHHNLRHLVQLLPLGNRGKQLRSHLSMSVISKLLDQKLSYQPSGVEFQLHHLHPYIKHMQPASLKKLLATRKSEQPEDTDAEDQEAYYLCYSLMALVNEASNFEVLPKGQMDQLKMLLSTVEMYVKSNIRESMNYLYRSKVIEFIARICIKWQVLLQRMGPSQGKIMTSWEPMAEDIATTHQNALWCQRDEQVSELENDDEESHVMSCHGEEHQTDGADTIAVEQSVEKAQAEGEINNIEEAEIREFSVWEPKIEDDEAEQELQMDETEIKEAMSDAEDSEMEISEAS
uniref:Coiled-coil SMC6 And NSE5 INteracting (CANIN) domain-containing protein n=2 Tax=Denticeps clupeoides TaxID=299321 RepID=A0AAY3ZU58_9TELE